MNFKAIQLSNGQYAVKKGRADSRGRFTYLTDTVTDSLEEAEQYADYRNALEAIAKARTAISKVTLQQAKEIAYDAYLITDEVQERCEAEDPNYSEYDPKGFLA